MKIKYCQQCRKYYCGFCDMPKEIPYLYFQLEKEVMAKGNVESWLGELLQEQQKSLHGVIRDAFRTINNDGFELISFTNGFPAQVSTVVPYSIKYTRTKKVSLNLLQNSSC